MDWRGRGTASWWRLSGGADSVALLLLLRELERDGALTVAGAAHLNHQLRGAEADADEAFCGALAARLGVPFVAERVDVAALARAAEAIDRGRGARSRGYGFFDARRRRARRGRGRRRPRRATTRRRRSCSGCCGAPARGGSRRFNRGCACQL